MDEKLREKFERLQKDGFLQKKYRIEAISERFEEVLQDFVEGSGMKYRARAQNQRKNAGRGNPSQQRPGLYRSSLRPGTR